MPCHIEPGCLNGRGWPGLNVRCRRAGLNVPCHQAGLVVLQSRSTALRLIFRLVLFPFHFLERNANHLFQQFTGLNARCRWAGLNARCRRAGLAVLCLGCGAPFALPFLFPFPFKTFPLPKPSLFLLSPLSPYNPTAPWDRQKIEPLRKLRYQQRTQYKPKSGTKNFYNNEPVVMSLRQHDQLTVRLAHSFVRRLYSFTN